MTCKECGEQFANENAGQIGLCQECWEEVCDMTCWEQVQIVAEGAD